MIASSSAGLPESEVLVVFLDRGNRVVTVDQGAALPATPMAVAMVVTEVTGEPAVVAEVVPEEIAVRSGARSPMFSVSELWFQEGRRE